MPSVDTFGLISRLQSLLGHAFGWRAQSEVLVLERRQVDLEAGTLRLDAGTTKNDEGRVVYVTPVLKSLVSAQVDPRLSQGLGDGV
jgi:hypothetical protein